MKLIITLLAALLAISAAPAQKRHQSTLTKKAATTIIRQNFPNASILSAEMENEEGKKIWSFDVKVSDTLKEIWLDAKTGKILKTETESAATEQEESNAEHAALKKIPGEVVSTTTKTVRGKTVYNFEIRTKRDIIVNVAVDSVTNQVVDIESEKRDTNLNQGKK